MLTAVLTIALIVIAIALLPTALRVVAWMIPFLLGGAAILAVVVLIAAYPDRAAGFIYILVGLGVVFVLAVAAIGAWRRRIDERTFTLAWYVLFSLFYCLILGVPLIAVGVVMAKDHPWIAAFMLTVGALAALGAVLAVAIRRRRLKSRPGPEIIYFEIR